MSELIDVPPGLHDVAVADTEIGDVVGDQGYYHYRGESAVDLARTETFEEVAGLVLTGTRSSHRVDRSLPPEVAMRVADVDLRSGLSLLGAAVCPRPLAHLEPTARLRDAERLIATFPTLLASVLHGRPVSPDPNLGHVADFLRMVVGLEATPQQVEALQTYFVLTIDHGFNNSTFAARVVASSGADLGSCVLAGYGSLTGPRHGANIERMLDMFDAIGTPSNAEDWMRAEVADRRRLQGFGHSVYRLDDPRLDLLRQQSERVNPDRYQLAVAAEAAGRRLLAGRRLVPNIDLYAPVVLEGCGIPRDCFTATFAAARIVGWCAHAIEQVSDDKIVRPAARYVGPPPDRELY